MAVPARLATGIAAADMAALQKVAAVAHHAARAAPAILVRSTPPPPPTTAAPLASPAPAVASAAPQPVAAAAATAAPLRRAAAEPVFPTHLRAEMSKKVRVVPYGVLGTQLDDGVLRRVEKEPTPFCTGTNCATVPAWARSFKGYVPKVAPPPPTDRPVVVVDPAGIKQIQGCPATAGGAAAAIYKWLNGALPLDSPFPETVRDAVRKPTQACVHEYTAKTPAKPQAAAAPKPSEKTRVLIHAAGPDLNADEYGTASSEADYQRALGDLAETYASILTQFAGWVEKKGRGAILRVVPVSGGLFAGRWSEAMPALTADALLSAIDKLSVAHKEMLTTSKDCSIELCIFDGKEYEGYTNALQQLRRSLILGDTHQAEGSQELLFAAGHA